MIGHECKRLATLAVLMTASVQAWALATPEELAGIGTKYTCTGAEKAGTSTGVAAFTGRYLGAMPGMVANGETGAHPTDPYAGEQPILTIMRENMAQYADRLTAGQQAMFAKYPTFRMHVYRSHRDFRYDDSVCKAALHNAQHAELDASGLKVNGAVRGAVPFPFPKTGQELVWNVLMAPRPATVFRDVDHAIVQGNGKIQWGAHLAWQYSPAHDVRLRGQAYDGIARNQRIENVLPEREKGYVSVTQEKFDFIEPAIIKHSSRICARSGCSLFSLQFDMPVLSAANTLGGDEIRLMNGSPERYDWKISGKKVFYQPANNYRLESVETGENKYVQLLTPNHENPAWVRWELRRAWVLEGTLKAGQRHLYPRRTLYVDEDSFQATMSDVYDAQGSLWRFNWANSLYVGRALTNTWEVYSAYYHDLLHGYYTAFDLTQAKPHSLVIDLAGAEYGKTEYEFYSRENLKDFALELFKKK